jgi:DNA helicase-2/ATP-dependent DNA helicase PcrA
MTEAEAILFLRKNLFLFNLKYFRPLGNPNKFLTALLQHFSRLQDEDISPKEYLQWAKLELENSRFAVKEEGEKYLELAQAYQKYLDLKVKEGVMDFSDLVYYLNQFFVKDRIFVKNIKNSSNMFLSMSFKTQISVSIS